MKHQAVDLNDVQLLNALIESGRLTKPEIGKFRDMLAVLLEGPRRKLSERQRMNAEVRFHDLELDADNEEAINLVSRGIVKARINTPKLIDDMFKHVPEQYRHPTEPPNGKRFGW